MNNLDAKRVLETALICAGQPLPMRDMRTLFADELGPDDLHALLDEIASDCEGAASSWFAGERLALPEPSRDARVPRPAEPREGRRAIRAP